MGENQSQGQNKWGGEPQRKTQVKSKPHKQTNENPNSWRPLALRDKEHCLSGQLLTAALDPREASRAASNHWALQSLALAVIRLCLGGDAKYEEVLTAALAKTSTI